MKIKCIHYGHDKFDINKFIPIENCNWIKPKGGLWASQVDSKYGWKDWCEEENYGNLSCNFIFTFKGKVLIIDSLKDMEDKIPFINLKEYIHICNIDFERLSKEYDAILLTENGEKETRFSIPKSLYGWDCESICIFNPNTVVI
jgi:hypothetical protein